MEAGLRNLKLSIENISVYMLFHHEWLAVKKSLDSVLKHYPNSQIILGRDQLEPEENKLLENFSYQTVKSRSCMEKFVLLKKSGSGLEFFSEDDLLSIIKCHIERAFDVANLANHEFILFLEPDGFMRYKHVPDNDSDMETLVANKFSLEVIEFVGRVSDKPLNFDGWGFVVGYVRKSTIIKMHKWFFENQDTVLELMRIDRRFAYMDFAFPLIAHMSKARVVVTDKVTECNRNKFWRISRKPMLHQYKPFHEV
jgi:hypothetical protein